MQKKAVKKRNCDETEEANKGKVFDIIGNV